MCVGRSVGVYFRRAIYTPPCDSFTCPGCTSPAAQKRRCTLGSESDTLLSPPKMASIDRRAEQCEPPAQWLHSLRPPRHITSNRLPHAVSLQPKQHPSGKSFFDLGHDIFYLLLRYISPEDVLNLGATCRHLRSFFRSESIWKHLCKVSNVYSCNSSETLMES